jgi:leucine dehydrogenase
MSNGIDSLLSGWDGCGVVVRHDPPSGGWIFIALHDDTLGVPVGGTRMKVYPSPADGLRDAQRLAEGMTHKWAALDFPFGGGKAVLALARPLAQDERLAMLRRYGRLLVTLRGAFQTGPDLGVTPQDLLEVAAEAPDCVHGVDAARGIAIDPGPFTARGVFASVKAAVGHAFGSPELAGRTVLVQGLGSVGRPLVRQLAAAGARLLLSDVDGERAAARAAELSAAVVAPEAVVAEPCDVYAPCATGAVLNQRTIPRLACRAVAGSANNQLEEAADADRLHRRGILYAPDFIANAGGAISLALLGRGASEEETFARAEAIGDTLREIFAEAERRGESPQAGAERRAQEVLARGRAGRLPAAG